MKAKVDGNYLELTAETEADKRFLRSAFDDIRLGKKALVPVRTAFGLELTLELKEVRK